MGFCLQFRLHPVLKRFLIQRMSMTHQQLMAMSKEQLVQAYEELENRYTQLQQTQANAEVDFNSSASRIEHEFAVAKRKLQDEITALKKEIAALKAKN
jgi:hypothetical protein